VLNSQRDIGIVYLFICFLNEGGFKCNTDHPHEASRSLSKGVIQPSLLRIPVKENLHNRGNAIKEKL